jgi:succinate dehydrogenase / fumarate reductase cytochrome b subunit
MRSSKLRRHNYRNIATGDLLAYMRSFPVSAWVSLLHRVSGALMFILLPAIIWAFDTSVSSEMSFSRWVAVFENGFWLAPGWLFKLVVLAMLWSYLHHLLAGLRFLALDLNHAAVDKARARRSAQVVLLASLGLTLVLGAKLFGLY